ncbi:2,5-dioxovalerate dehydrogenase [Sphingosinicella microcystinivorans]|uniref:2,5-dioxovalerate dehydrogenase n=2 Tax=Sphingosinicella microcystinivorans TaxID=335406 RepID=A0AAD1G2D9_SPHMI|nr:2,5-dioxopentanoate dehydrogenase [Sphingosinicella microcystinivorans]BBE35665.1 2,5-dioxovalerate dehydrogenase [Sphingosinicella microcystinivorans]
MKAEMFIGASAVVGTNGHVSGVNPATGETLEPPFGGATLADADRAAALADAAFDAYRETAPEARAVFLETIADNILAIGDALIERAMAETGLPRARLEGERGRTMGQLRLFADIVRDGGYLGLRVDPAMPERQPLPRSDLRLRHIPLGPVVVFGASNFPLAFSVAGGDTASALAAGCPVIVKAHSAHPGTSALVGRAVRDAVAACGLPEGVFSMIFDSGRAAGQALVADPRVKAVGFTGSRGGGLALVAIAQARPEPIPVYAEMSSINPVILLPQALEERAEAIGKGFVASLTLGAGQFCTNPGLVIAVEGPALDRFVASTAEALGMVPAATMLTPGIHAAYARGAAATADNPAVEVAARGQGGGGCAGQAAFFTTSAAAFLKDRSLQEEMFGAASLLVRCADADELAAVVASLEGQLTAALHLADGDHDAVRALLPLLERKAGRILVNGFGTGVEVSHAMVHGGPFPSTSDARTTSVGGLAIQRFLRPVCYQDMPDALLPDALKAANPLGFDRLVNGKR